MATSDHMPLSLLIAFGISLLEACKQRVTVIFSFGCQSYNNGQRRLFFLLAFFHVYLNATSSVYDDFQSNCLRNSPRVQYHKVPVMEVDLVDYNRNFDETTVNRFIYLPGGSK